MTVPELDGSNRLRGALCGLAAAASFGVSAPLAKLLLAELSPFLLAGLLYGGAAIGLWLLYALAPGGREAALKREDMPKLLGIIAAGGVLGPLLLLFGLARVSALSGSLVLNLEAPFTVLLAVLLFGEHLGKHAAAATACILAGALVLRVQPGELSGDWSGLLLIAAACACWALDNNLTQRLSLRDPFAIVRIKTLAAGMVNSGIGLATLGDAQLPSRAVLGALLLGSVSYGASVVFDAYALRLVGAVREAAYFATAPFLGALLAISLLGEPLRWSDLVAMAAMALGVVLLLRERHSHLHVHEALEHEHLHAHDAHHQHEHAGGDPSGEPHSHRHRHAPLAHEHAHLPDLHHRHRH